MKRIIKPLWLALATLSALLTVVSCVKELAVKEQEVNFESSLTTEQSQIVKGDSIVSTQLLVNEEEVDCPRPTKYSVSFAYDEEAGTLFFLGDSIQSGKPIALSSLSNLALTYQAKKLVGNKVDVTVSNDAPKKLSKELVWNILADKTYWVKSEQEGEGEVTITGADDLDAVKPDTKLAVTAKPADGWELVALTANEEDILEDKSFLVTENTTVRATFKEQAPETYAVTLTKEGEGKVAISGSNNLDAVVAGSKLTISAIPADGWEVKIITANGKDITTDKSFVVTSNTTVKVVFKRLPPKTYTVTLVKEGDGKVAISGADNLGAVVTGAKLTVSAEPADGWEVKSITANGKDITTEKSFVVTENTMVRVIFEEKALEICSYTIGLLKEGEGKVVVAPMKPVKPASLYGSGVPTIEIDPFEIDPSRINHVPCGVEVTLIATPADGWKLVSLEADGWDPLFGKSFSINRNTTVRATFTKKAPTTYAVTLTKEGEGKVVISGADNLGAVVAGTKLTVTATPADGWEISSITANGKDITTEKSFVVTSNTVVKVVFKRLPPKTYKVTLITDGGGEVTITGADDLNRVPAGTELYIIATPGENKVLKSLTVNGKQSGFSFVVTEDTVVKVSFADEQRNVPLPGHTPNEYDYQRNCSIKVLMVDQDTVKLPIPIKQYKEFLNIEAVHVKDEKIYNRFPCHFSEVELSEKIEGLFRCDFFYIDWYRVIQPFLQIKQKKPLRDYTFSHATVNAVGKTIDGTFRKDKIKSLSPTAPILDILPELAGSYELTRLPLAHCSDHTNPLDNYLEVICFFKRK